VAHDQISHAADFIGQSVRAEDASRPAPSDSAATATAGHPLVLFDGVCGLCNWSVDFLLRHDSRAVLRFAPLQGSTAASILASTPPHDPQAPTSSEDSDSLKSLILVDDDGIHRRSTAVIRILRLLGGKWKLAAALLWLVPKPIRELGYRLTASNRYRLFGKKETCRMPSPQERQRFLP
jgi:predicted DCC family thiol-disulfide oxidoreductase YuxK